MRQIQLQAVQLEHFRSFVKPSTIQFDDPPGLKLISGRNEVEPRLGANGAGKSSLWDAVCWGLYGTSIKGLRTSDLVSGPSHWDRSIGPVGAARQIEVWVKLEIDGEAKTIHRTGPPGRLLIDDQPAEQIDVDRLVGLSRSRFLNSVVFGQAQPLFVDLPIPARGDLLDEVLDLELWMRAADRTQFFVKAEDGKLAKLRLELARQQGRLESVPDIAELARQGREWDDARDARLGALQARLEGVEAERAALPVPRETEAATLATKLANARDRHRRQVERSGTYQRRAAVLRSEMAKLRESVEFFNTNEVCPVCAQPMSRQFIGRHLMEISTEEAAKIEELEGLNGHIRTSHEREAALLRAVDAAQGEMMLAEGERRANEVNQKAKEAEAQDLQRQISRCRAEVNPYDGMRMQSEELKTLLELDIAQKQDAEAALVSRLADLNYWRNGFRKVRLFCLENVLAELSVATRNSLMALGLIDWRIAFKTATETRSGTVKLGVQVDVQPPQRSAGRFDVLSGGEGQRARLAGSLGLASLVQRWAGVQWRLEVWDEPTAWLSEEGVANLLDALAERAQVSGKAIYVVDHRALMHGSFDKVMTIVKDATGSFVEA